MTLLSFRPKTALAAALFPLAATAAMAAEEGSFDRTLSVTGPVQLEVRTGSGSIQVEAGAPGTVEVHGSIRARSGFFAASGAAEKVRRIEESPPIQQQGNVVRVGAGVIEDETLYDGVSISYRIVVPAETALVSKSGSGSQTLGNLKGPVESTAGSGSLEIGTIGADVQARAGSGSIRIEGVGGNLQVKTGSGSIAARAVRGAISASAGSGAIDLEQAGEGDVSIDSGSGGVRVRGVRGGLSVSTSSGSIRAQGEILRDWSLAASSGGIEVELPAEASFDLDASTGSGSIDSERPVSVSGRISRRSLKGAVGSGGPRLQLETSSGSIVIR
jgi:hypothetical protein